MNPLRHIPTICCFLALGMLSLSFRMPMAKRKLMADKSATTITYAMRHPMHTWEGVSRDVTCAVVYNDETNRIENVAAVVKVASFDSQNSNRDSHALESTEALKYPNITFSSQDIQPGDGNTLTIRGNMTFHNVTRPMTIQATRKEASGKLTIDGNFDFKLTDFKIEKPSLMMVPVEDEVKMRFVFVFKMPANS
ncbi:YceI family protein [Tellurirhabdus bombi]|uniref:YceI family protein n=1 Tax=Tellurirhabdus bombi TaxID=2907205 RepID=UPI001F1AB09F|nr:YceI family protein [Tellurirhabdus bombi]